MMHLNKSVSVVIPNWNGVNLLRKHLLAVIASCVGSEIIVVDDASTDESLDLLSQKFPEVKVIKKSSHDGFASTVNLGVKAANGEIVVLLNTDVEPEKNFLKPLLTKFSDQSVFGVGCLDRSFEGIKVIERGRGLAKWNKGFFIHWRGETDKADTIWVSGGSGAFRKDVWEKLGGMDELFNPFYWEDIDLSYRALKSGYKLIFCPESIVNHYHEEGSVKNNYSDFKVKSIAYKNQFIFIWKNLSDGRIWLDHCLWTPVRLIQAIFTLDLAMVVGYFFALIRLPRVLISRYAASKYWQKAGQEILST